MVYLTNQGAPCGVFNLTVGSTRNAVPLDVLHQGQQAAGVTDQFVQEGDDVGELGPMASLLLPAVQHELVQGHGAAHGCRQPVALLDGQNHLQGAEWSSLKGPRTILNSSQLS